MMSNQNHIDDNELEIEHLISKIIGAMANGRFNPSLVKRYEKLRQLIKEEIEEEEIEEEEIEEDEIEENKCSPSMPRHFPISQYNESPLITLSQAPERYVY